VDDALRFAPIFPDLESLPDLSSTALEEIEAVRIRVNGYLHRELTQDAPTVASGESKQRSLSLEVPRTSAILDGQVEEQMAVNDVGVGLALSAPYARQATCDAAAKEPFMESFTDFGEERAVGIVKHDRAGPMDCCMGNQGKADCSRMIDCFDEVGRLV